MNTTLPTGTSIRMTLADCRCDPLLLTSCDALAPLMSCAAADCALEPLEWVGHDFAGGGHTTCVLLAESHVTVHSYPETRSSVVVEISICDFQKDNRQLARDLAVRMEALFEPGETALTEQRW
jgi:S-adenosylmethionine decarboxylase